MARQASNTFSRTVTFYDENFDEKTEKAEGTISVAATQADAESMLGGPDAVLKALNVVLREKQIAAAVQAKSGGMDSRYIKGFIKPMTMNEPFASIESEKEQTKAILTQIKQVPFLLDQLKKYCEARAKQEAEGETEEN